MYQYSWYQWLLFFFIYCFFGWIFESAYVSLRKKRFINRGFLRLPLLPLYGTGAVMMLWVSLPVKNSLILVYLSGVIAATILEYITGWGMECLFKIRYWDYSDQKWNLNGYICLSSSLTWGVLTILLTEFIHRPIERFVLRIPSVIAIVISLLLLAVFTADTIESIRTALNLAKVLDTLTHLRTELDEMQVQMALLKAETKDKAELYHRELFERRQRLIHQMGYYRREILRGNPSATSARFADALKELKEAAASPHILKEKRKKS